MNFVQNLYLLVYKGEASVNDKWQCIMENQKLIRMCYVTNHSTQANWYRIERQIKQGYT